MKPSRAASRSRCSNRGAGRTCPVRLISPIAQVVRGIGRERAALANAATIARSQAGSFATPPAIVDTYRSLPSRLIRPCRYSTATSIAMRFVSTPLTARRGVGSTEFVTSACTSIGSERCPSSVNVTQVPSTGVSASDRNNPEGSATSATPSPLISKQPTSSVGPNRFFTARSMRRAVWASPSNWQTTSTRCSSVRGPAIDPSLVTCPTSSTGTSRLLAVSIKALATSRTCVEPPEMPSTSWETMVCAESTMASAGRSRSISPSTVARSVVEASSRFGVTASMRAARMRTCAWDSSPDRYSTVRSGCRLATAPAVCSSRVDLPMPGSPATSVTDPGTMPPPRTRSNSPNPVGSRWMDSVPTSVIGVAVPSPT